jgi:nucleotide-binding universal stress UspA family protein
MANGDIDAAELASAKRIFARVFVPVDFSISSHVAVGAALQLQRLHGSAVRLFHAVQSDATNEWLGGIGSPAVGGDWVESARTRLQRFVVNLAPESVGRVEIEAELPSDGDVVRVVRHAAVSWGATLLVATARVHARFFRSSAERLVHDVELPTLIIPTASRA